jgi:hypothetical protein
MPVFLCRWPNGEFSIVSAATKSDAIELLDEWGNAEAADITRIPDCMFDFRLNDRGEIELSQISQYTEDLVREKCYPELQQIILDAIDDEGEYKPGGLEQIRAAVHHERTRLWKSSHPPKQADTELGRELQRGMDASSVVANRAVRHIAKRILESKDGEDGKVQ